jgi:asparagine synthase (glutamine-hydrolysing)
MSGIVGIYLPENQSLVKEMLELISHRGNSDPEDWNSQFGSMGTTSISDIKENPGPVVTPSGDRAAVMDGWLSNDRELYQKINYHQLKDGSSVEIVLHAYEDLGSNLFDNMEGAYALAVFDKNRCLLARDRLGIRPLYYGFKNQSLLFGSEIKAIAKYVDRVHEFPPGHYLDSERGIFPYKSYIPEEVTMDGAISSAERLGDLVIEAVDRSVPEGLEIGVWLSGGVDSSIIAALAKRCVTRLHTFSAGVQGGEDLVFARMVADHIHSDHHEKIYRLEDMLSILEKVIYSLESFDAALVRSTIANYMVSELASDYVSFVLSGEGGDELFAGYDYQKTYQSEMELLLSVQNAIGELHNTALQRVDRAAAAHSTVAAVPFLDPAVVRFAMAIPVQWKIRGAESVEKWPLRKGLEQYLPDAVVWRPKAKFWQGAGSASLIEDYASQEISDEEYKAERDLSKDFRIRSKEELLYYRIFKKHFGNKVPLAEVGRTQYI